jgi:acyl-CoA dehydrogenase
MYVVGRPHADVQAGRISSLNKLPGPWPRLFLFNRTTRERARMGRRQQSSGEGAMMDLGMTERVGGLVERVRAMVDTEIIPREDEYFAEIGKAGDRFVLTPRQIEILEDLKQKAKTEGLWNFWLTDSERGFGLTTVEYAYLAEVMGWSRIAAEIFNCAAPDTGNMEVIERYGTAAHKARWLKPLLDGEIRSAYCMTEPDVASSDATNIAMAARRDGDHWVLNGEKWWASGAGDPRCAVYIVMCRTDPDADRHHQHSQFIVAADAPGIDVLRPMHVYGHDDAPHGHMHIRFTDVRVPADDLILGEGRGFEVAQGRLGPGRIHHCMRAVGQAERALELMCKRALERTAFGRPLAHLGANYDIIAECRIEIEMARLLCLKAAHMMDTVGVRAAQPWISQIKVVAPRMAMKVTDEAIQMHGGMGISQDAPLAGMWLHLRTLRLADGPDAVHRRQVARRELKQYTNEAT